ncbi:MAG: hypothetical protein B6241_13900 [Spirochaetaceae bacterium 4572_59]|nr:MAG: hypothetical protein B6241_13900 [Spirochaetaceae bacterium 4572_59]
MIMNNTENEKLRKMEALQNIIFPRDDSAPRELYFRSWNYSLSEKGLVIDKGGSLDFSTYFNLFSFDKWNEYTGLESLSLVMNISGSCVVKLYSFDDNGEVIKESVRNVPVGGDVVLTVPEILYSGHIGMSIEATSLFRLKSAYWGSALLLFQRHIRTAAVFCTYNRDEFLFPNLKVIRNSEIENLDVFVVDNASRIDESSIKEFGDDFYLFHNPNTGGSGGFTRGLMEALKSDVSYTHVLFMDDDIRLEGETLFRSQTLLSHLRPEYKKHFLSGAMLQLDKPHLMFESTARWNGVRVKNYKKDLDLRSLENLCQADRNENNKNSYAAWWYCGIPLSKGMERDLPFPFFIYGDDMDYSLKRASGLLTLNGIGVWHEPFTKKFSPLFKSYFFCRNTMILNSLHSRKFNYFHNALNSAAHFFVQLFVHDYRSASLALDALEDYLEGAEYVAALDEGDILSRSGAETDFRTRSIKELNRAYPIQDNFRRWFSPWYFMHKKLAVYSYDRKTMEIRRRSFKTVFALLGRFCRLRCLFFIRYSRVSRSYRKLERNEQFWQQRFDAARGA